MPFEGIWKSVFGQPEKGGAWLIYGAEKNGKTTFALMLANYLSTLEPVLYISAEEGLQDSFTDACMRAGLSPDNKSLKMSDYIPIEELRERLRKRKSQRIVVLDNITIYQDELKNGNLWGLLKEFPSTVFIFLAHEKNGDPYTATAQACKRYAKIIVHLEGLVAFVSGRCPGGRIVINEEKAELCYGDGINESESYKM